MHGTAASDLEAMAADRTRKGSDAALWMLLLLRLTTVASDDRLDLRNSAIQTLLRIFDAYGERLTPEAWSICIKSVVFKLLTSLEEELRAADDDELEESDRAEWNGTAVVVLNGISSLLANYIDVLTAHPSFNHLWRELLGHFASLLDFEVLDINTATFKALSHVLSQTSEDGKPIFNDTTVDVAWELWARRIPTSKSRSSNEDNQGCLIAYVAALQDVYKLIQADLTVDRVKRMLALLRETVEEASVGGYSSDIEYVTSLQGQILEAVQMIRTDVGGVPSATILQVSEFVTLAYDHDHAPASKRTYVAMSKASMKMLEGLILSHATDKDIYTSGAFSAALAALCRPITLKYSFSIVTKSAQPWRLATSSALAVLEATLSQLKVPDIPRNTIQDVWTIIVAIADGIVCADCESAPSGTNFGDDEVFDIAAFRKLRGLIIPSLGADVVPDKTRKAYTGSLFKTSIIHAPTPSDTNIIYGGDDAGLSALYKTRIGRTMSVPPTTRAQMSYVVFDELFSLVSTEQSAATDTSKSSGVKQGAQESPSVLFTRIACTAAPYLILRCALTLRAYAADQPLRGKMPQPLSQRKELLWVLRKLVDLRSESDAIPELGGVESESRKHLLRLYPLMVKALGVTGDGKVLQLLREGLEVVGGELGT